MPYESTALPLSYAAEEDGIIALSYRLSRTLTPLLLLEKFIPD